MKVLSIRNLVIRLNTTLKILQVPSLQTVYKNKNVTCISLHNNNLVYSTTCHIHILDLYTFSDKKVYTCKSSITSMFILDCYIYTGHVDGLISKLCMISTSMKVNVSNESMKVNVSNESVLPRESSTIMKPISSTSITHNISPSITPSITHNITPSITHNISHNITHSIKLYKTYKHNLPIQEIVSNGEHIYISDMSNKVQTYPCLISYDIEQPVMKYMKYIFISEYNKLYCSTRNSLCSYIHTETTILDYVFTRNGSVVFIVLYNKIVVYEFNTKTVIFTINESYTRVTYNDDMNILIGFTSKEQVVHQDVLLDTYDEMDNVIFDDIIIHNKHVYIDEEEYTHGTKAIVNTRQDTESCDTFVEASDTQHDGDRGGTSRGGTSDRHKSDRHKSCDRDESSNRNKVNNKKNINNTIYDNISNKRIQHNKTHDKQYDIQHDNHHDKQHGIQNDIQNDNSSDEVYKTRRKDGIKGQTTTRHINNSHDIHSYTSIEQYSSTPCNIFPIVNIKGDRLLYYNNTGYLLLINSTHIELRHHDRNTKPIEVLNTYKCTNGVLYNNSMLLYNKTHAYYYNNEELKWTKVLDSTYSTHVCLTQTYVIINNKHTTIYDVYGIEVLTFYIRNVNLIIEYNKKIVVFSTVITIIDIHKSTEEYSLPGVVTWACVYDKLYVKIDTDIYIIVHGLCQRVLCDVVVPLTVIRHSLISLHSSDKFIPVQIRHHSMKE